MCVTVPLPYYVISVVGSPQSQASHRTEASQVCSIFDLASSLQDLNYMFDLVQLTWWPHCRQVRLASNLGVPDWQSRGRALKARRTWPGWSNINRRIVTNNKCKTFNLHTCFGFHKPTCAFPGYRTIVFRRPSTPEITPSRYFAVDKNQPPFSYFVKLRSFQ